MNDQEIQTTLNDVIRDVLGDPDFEITPNTSAKDHPAWDSFNHLNIIVATEMKLGIKFHTGEIDGLRNVGDFTALISRKRTAA